ncbi:Phytoene desaturase (neurosporene-forming) [Corynebacterium occultum]|uniref:Pyridine nucleotide-disulfide oxidoreductase domain-containing protein 2 n=1 Tax=Corynebacterium occultum TaxID=2675219 RepID=A0A6B8W339_9CORY|nr:NAD(P)/FAD-dependent oxidoreductase [Corynebacterium occultum]QGU06397.1 Phytoene desaturase (neurosporene-forming) [Corynebacterium occultum]
MPPNQPHDSNHHSRPRANIVGSGPNGLSAALQLAREGWEVEIFERNEHPGGAAASAPLLGEGTIVDRGAAAHPFGVASPVFREFELEKHGLEWCHSTYPMAHPMADQPAAFLHRDLAATAAGLSGDGKNWKRAHGHLVSNIDEHLENILGPMLRWPKHPLRMAQFGTLAALPAKTTAEMLFREESTRALFLGSGVHAITPPNRPFTTAFALLFGSLGMSRGWPVVRGGTQGLVDALLSALNEHGVKIHTGVEVHDLRELPPAEATVLNLTPAQILRLQHTGLAPRVLKRLAGWKYGAGVFKVDYLLDGPVPWSDPRVGEASTVHVVGGPDEIQHAEAEVARGRMPDRPFVMVCQQQVADPTRATGPAAGKQVLWSYAHVPQGYREPQPGFIANLIESQIERFAPGFRERIQHQVQHSPDDLESWNPNLIGGDIAGGGMQGLQSLLRPGITLNPYRLNERGLYLASGATPPGAGVHGVPGSWAARAAMQDQGGK